MPIFDDIDDYLRSRHRLSPRGLRREYHGYGKIRGEKLKRVDMAQA
jgi:hypothetical protein